MRAWTGSAVLLMAVFALSGCASQDRPALADGAVRDCFSSGRISGFTPVDSSTIRLRVGVKDAYELKLLSYCPDVDWTQRIALRSAGGSSMICTNDAMGWEILVLDRPGIGPDRCRVRSIRKLEPEPRDTP